MDDEAPFSESMLEWLEEGDRMADAPPGSGPRPSAAYHTTEASGRRSKIVIGGVVALAGIFVVALRLSASGKPKAEEQAAAVTPAPAVVAAEAPPAAELAAQAAPLAPADPAAAVAPAAATAAPAELPAPAEAAPVAVAAPAVAQAAAVPQPAPVRAMQPTPPTAVPVAAPVAAAPVPVPVAQARPTVAMAELQRPVAAPIAAPTDAYGAALAQCRAFMTAGQIKHAVTSCRQATEARPGSAEALTLLAEAEFTRGHSGLALRLATEATTADQNFAEAYVVIGGIYQDKGKDAEARAAYEQYLALEPRGKHAGDLRAILGAL